MDSGVGPFVDAFLIFPPDDGDLLFAIRVDIAGIEVQRA